METQSQPTTSIETAHEIALYLHMPESLFPLFFQAIQRAENYLLPGTCCRVLNTADASRDLVAIKGRNGHILILFFGEPVQIDGFKMYDNPLGGNDWLPGINITKFS